MVDKSEPQLDQVTELVRTFIAKELGRREISSLKDDDSLFDSGILDSMGVIEVITFCEQNFNITFDLSSVDEAAFSSLSRIATSVIDLVQT